MCLIVFAYNCHPNYRLILAANRDEYFHRPTKAAQFWEAHPLVLAGQDLEKQGTWLGITRTGRLAALTNFRDPSRQLPKANSRGELVSHFLSMNEDPITYLQTVNDQQSRYNPFNLLVGTPSSLVYYSNQTSTVTELRPGIYGLSNHLLDTPWPKVQKSKKALEHYIKDRPLVEAQALLNLLADEQQADDKELPNTGIGYQFEKHLSSIFIRGSDYGTRSSTVLLIGRNNQVVFLERSFHPGQTEFAQVSYQFELSEP